MKTIAVCPDCAEEAAKNGKQYEFNPILGELDDNGMIHVTCDRGHIGVVLYNSRRYEVLVKSAARAALDGYTNEVVAVMYTALERMYEFYIRVSSRAKGMPEATVEEAWKNVATQSERQFGAFQFLYMLDQSRTFKIDKRITETRNSVIHRGKIVREVEALEFSENVYSVIQHLQTELQSKFPKFVAEEAEREMKVQQAQVPEGVKFVKLASASVKVDKAKNEVTRSVTRFIEHVAAMKSTRESVLSLKKSK